MNLENIPFIESELPVFNWNTDEFIGHASNTHNFGTRAMENEWKAVAEWIKSLRSDRTIHISYENVHTQKEQSYNPEEWMELLE